MHKSWLNPQRIAVTVRVEHAPNFGWVGTVIQATRLHRLLRASGFPLLLISTLLLLAGCGSGANQPPSSSTSQPPSSGSNPTPTVNSISPTNSTAGGAAFTLTINGTNFVAASTVNFGGSAPATTFVSSTQLTAAIPAVGIASSGMLAVTVTNPKPGGGTSNSISFTVNSDVNGVPTISSLGPSCVPAGEQSLDYPLSVGGLNFVASSVVRWNGISASDIAAAGTATVTVFNPPPSGGSSNSLTFTITPGAVDPQSIAVDPAGKFAYVANALGCPSGYYSYVSMYTIDTTTGALTSIGPPASIYDDNADFITVDPSARFAYVTTSGDWYTSDGSISTHTINPTTGALTYTGSVDGNSPDFCCFTAVAVDPFGKFAYATDGGGGETGVYMYTINATTGALSSIGKIATGGFPVSMAVHSSGKFAYVATWNDALGSAGTVSIYTINGTTGALTSAGTIATGARPVSVVVDPAGKFAYVANEGTNDVSMYTINGTTGALTSIGTIAAGTDPVSVAVDPSGKFAYVTNFGSNDVSMYTINGTTGALTPIGMIAAGLSPTSIATHPSGKFVYVTNSGSNDVSMYSLDTATGVLTLIGTVGT
jgi:YVTN family beta-propeller protein